MGPPTSGPGLTIGARRGLRGQVALITGAGGEIGRAIGERLTLEGVRVLLADRDLGLAQDAAATITADGGEAQALPVDITDQADLERVGPVALARFGALPSIVVCCAGIQTFGDIYDLSVEEWDRVLAVNGRGTFLTMQLAARMMREAGRGSIVTIASVQGRLGSRYYAHYSASKAAVLSLTKSFAVALAPHRVRVNAVAPGIVDTKMWRTADAELARIRGVPPGEPRRQRVEQVPLGRAGTAEDVAGAVAFLASEEASYVTGECLHVCGGDLML